MDGAIDSPITDRDPNLYQHLIQIATISNLQTAIQNSTVGTWDTTQLYIFTPKLESPFMCKQVIRVNITNATHPKLRLSCMFTCLVSNSMWSGPLFCLCPILFHNKLNSTGSCLYQIFKLPSLFLPRTNLVHCVIKSNIHSSTHYWFIISEPCRVSFNSK